MNFDSSGNLTSVTTPVVPATVPPSVVTSPDLKVTGWIPGTVTNGVWTANGAASGVVTVSMDKTTQYNADTARSIPTQNGYATGQITNLTIDTSGVMLANFSNSQTKAIGQISLASFTNEQGLQPVGGTSWKETYCVGYPGLRCAEHRYLGRDRLQLPGRVQRQPDQ